jgi:hypothetical protein
VAAVPDETFEEIARGLVTSRPPMPVPKHCLHDERLGYPQSMGSFVSAARANKLFQSGPFDFQKVL